MSAPDTPAGSPRWSDRATALATPVVTLILVSVSWFYQCFPEAEEVKSFFYIFIDYVFTSFCVVSLQVSFYPFF